MLRHEGPQDRRAAFCWITEVEVVTLSKLDQAYVELSVSIAENGEDRQLHALPGERDCREKLGCNRDLLEIKDPTLVFPVTRQPSVRLVGETFSQ